MVFLHYCSAFFTIKEFDKNCSLTKNDNVKKWDIIVI